MDINALEERISAANDKFVIGDDEVENDNQSKEEGVEQPSSPQIPFDLADLMRRQRMAESKKARPNGANPKIASEIEYMAKKRLDRSFNIAKDTVETLAKNGDTARARMVQDQYMNDTFLPVLEAMTHIVPVDEMVNASSALDKLDEYVLTPGGSSKGYTKAFIQQLYASGMGRTEPRTDGYVADVVRRVKGLVSDYQIRTAVGLATKTKNMIDSGEHSASNEDYELLQKVAERGM